MRGRPAGSLQEAGGAPFLSARRGPPRAAPPRRRRRLRRPAACAAAVADAAAAAGGTQETGPAGRQVREKLALRSRAATPPTLLLLRLAQSNQPWHAAVNAASPRPASRPPTCGAAFTTVLAAARSLIPFHSSSLSASSSSRRMASGSPAQRAEGAGGRGWDGAMWDPARPEGAGPCCGRRLWPAGSRLRAGAPCPRHRARPAAASRQHKRTLVPPHRPCQPRVGLLVLQPLRLHRCLCVFQAAASGSSGQQPNRHKQQQEAAVSMPSLGGDRQQKWQRGRPVAVPSPPTSGVGAAGRA